MRYLAIKVASDYPQRFRLIREALPHERTDYPKQVILSLNAEAYTPVVMVRPGYCGMLVTDTHGIEVLSGEPPFDGLTK